MRYDKHKANVVFTKWSPLLCNPSLPLSPGSASATWLSRLDRVESTGGLFLIVERSFAGSEWLDSDAARTTLSRTSRLKCIGDVRRSPSSSFSTGPVVIVCRSCKQRLSQESTMTTLSFECVQVGTSHGGDKSERTGDTFGGAHPQRFKARRWETSFERACG